MASTADIKRKINSVKSSAKITKALQLVSAVKMRKIQQNYQNSQYYVDGLKRILANVTSNNGQSNNPLLRKVEHPKNALIVVVGTSRGYVGAQLSKLGASTYALAQSLKANKINVKILTIKKRALSLMNRYGLESNYHFDSDYEKSSVVELSPIKSIILSGFINQEFDEIYLAYTRFFSVAKQEPIVEKFLPFSIKEILGETLVINNGAYLFEPDADEIIDKLLNSYLEIAIYNTLLSATASEYSARMLAMQKATDNALEISKTYQLSYNKARQAAITQQIQEIANASIS